MSKRFGTSVLRSGGVAPAEEGDEVGGHECRLLVEVWFADRLQSLLATPDRPLGLTDGFEGEAAVVGHGSCGAE